MADQPFWFHPEARVEAIAAHDRYAEKSVAVGELFQAELERARAAIIRNPTTWAGYLYGTQRYLLHRFPYVVVYRVADGRIEVIAVAHGHQRPGYWAKRIDCSQ